MKSISCVRLPYELGLCGLETTGCSVQLVELEGELGAYLLKLDTATTGLVKEIAVTTDKYEITLIMKGDNLAAPELRYVGKEGHKETTDPVTELGHKIIEDELGGVTCCPSVSVDVLPQPNGGDLEDCSRALWKLDERQSFKISI